MRKIVKSFAKDHSAMITIKTGLLFGAVAMALSVLSAPILDNVSQTYAENRAFGIDRVITGSVQSNSSRYIVRKSVLSQSEERIELLD